MKIGVFTDSYRPYVSGVVCSIETFSEELIKRGHEVYVFAPRYPSYQVNNVVNQVNVYRFPSFRTPFYPEFYIGVPIPWPAKKSVREYGLDVIHVHSPFVLGLLGASFARQLGIPLIFTYHTLYDQYIHYLPLAGELAQKAVISITKDFCNRCDLVVTPTSVIKNLIRSYGVTSPIIPIPTGIKLDRFQQGDPDFLQRQYGVSPDDRVLLYVGRLGKEKNLDYLLTAFSMVVKEMSNTTLVLVGSGPDKEELEKLAVKLGVNEKVVFTGLISPEKVTGAYLSADIFAFPSVTETQGLVLVEAMAAGLPVVAQAAFGSLDMIKDGVTGYLCQDGIDNFAGRLLTLLSNSELRRQMGQAGQELAGHFSSARMAVRLERAYQAMIDGDSEVIRHLAEETL